NTKTVRGTASKGRNTCTRKCWRRCRASHVGELREDVREAIELSLPEGVVEMAMDPDDSYVWDVLPKLQKAFGHMPGARLREEREPDNRNFDEDECEDDRSRSYYLFFIVPDGKAFRYSAEIEGED